MSSWLGGGLSSLRGQLSHLITEDPHEDPHDPSDEVIVARLKITELEGQLKSSSLEMKELTAKNSQLQIKLQSEEMMLQQVSDSYKYKLKEKEEYLDSLRDQMSLKEMNRYNQSGCEVAVNEFYDFVNESSIDTKVNSNYVMTDELKATRLKVSKLEQEVLQWRSMAESGYNPSVEQGDSVSRLLETQRQDLELQHSNYVLELQQEHNKQVHFLQRKLQRCERGSDNEEYGLPTLSHSLLEGAIVSSVKEDLFSLFETICRKVENKQLTVEVLLRKLQDCESSYNPRESVTLCDVASQCLPELPSSMTYNSLQKYVPLSNFNVTESMSQVSDISQVSVTTRLLDENVRHLNTRIAEYGHQLTSIKDVTLIPKGEDHPEEITDKLQDLKIKLSERKNKILDHNNLLCNLEVAECQTFGDSWENSSINSLVEEVAFESPQILNIKSQVQDIIQTLGEEGVGDDLGITEVLCILKEKVEDVVKNKDEYVRIKAELINLQKDLPEVENPCDDMTVILEDIKQKMLEGQVINRRDVSNDYSDHVSSEYIKEIAKLNEEIIDLSRKNEDMREEVEDMSSTITRYVDLEKVCDNYQKDLQEIKGGKKKSDLCMASDDILEHVKTFNEEKDEFIEKLESRIISLQNFCEEKDDYIKALKSHELELIYEYDCSIAVLNCELDNLRATVEKSYENEIDYKKQIYRINLVTREKDDMINSLNEELTMLSHQNTEEDMVMMMSRQKLDVFSQTEDSDCLEVVEDRVEMIERIDMLVAENMRLGEVIEAQANSLGLYDSRVKCLETEQVRLCDTSHGVVNSESSEDMTRETLQHLSQMIRDKDWEIEALKSKNESLYNIIKESSESSDNDPIVNIERLVNEKESLTKEISWYQENREQLVNALNLKHKESLNYHGEIQRLVAFINSEQSKWNQLNLENENIKEEMRLLIEEKRTGKVSGICLVDRAVECDDSLPSYSECVRSGSIEQSKVLTERLLHLQQENQQCFGDIKKLEKQLEKVTFELEESRLQVYTLKESHNLCQTQIIHYQDELSKICRADVTCNQLSEDTKDIWNENNQVVKSLESKGVSVLDIEEQLRLLKLQVTDHLHQMDQMKTREMKLLREKQIFQEHLIRVEESYTQDATIAEDREQSLRKQLREAEDKLTLTEEHITHLEKKLANLTDNFLIETCDIRVERDESLRKLRSTELKLNEALQSLNNLQRVLDQIQQDHSAEMSFQRERLQLDLRSINEDRDKWKMKCLELQISLKAQNEVVDAAQRITDQMEWKDDQLAEMQASMSRREEVIDNLKMEIRKLNLVTESKVDKVLMRNLIIGYFHTPFNKRQDALRVIGSLLQFSDKDYNQIGIDTANKSRWFSWLRSASLDDKGHDQANQEHSFSELFVRFLERESNPLPQVRFPTNQVAADARKHSSLSYTEEFPYVNMTSATTISDHHKLFSPSPMITKRNASLGQESGTTEIFQEEAPALCIANLQELKSDDYLPRLNSTSSVRKTDSNKNALLSLLEQ